MHHEIGRHNAPLQALFLERLKKVNGHRIKYFIDGKIALRRAETSGFKSIDIKQTRSHAGHGVDRMAYADDDLLPLAVRMLLLERPVQESQSLQRLPQIVACGGEKN